MSKMERPFDEELKLLKEKLLEMAARAEEQIALAIRGLKDREEELACQVLEREEAINRLDIEIDEMAMRLLALRQPMATDLRFITSAMKIGSDLERIGDLAVNIAERTLDLLKAPQLKPLIDIPRMALWPRAWSGTPSTPSSTATTSWPRTSASGTTGWTSSTTRSSGSS